MHKSDGRQRRPSLLDPADQARPEQAGLWFTSQSDMNREVSLHKDPILKVKG
jgi:hypothetical protein